MTNDLTERRRTEEKVQQLNTELRQHIAQLDESRRLVELRTIELQKLSSQLLQVQDDERRRIARELHDDLGQQLAAIKMLMSPDAQTKKRAKWWTPPPRPSATFPTCCIPRYSTKPVCAPRCTGTWKAW